MLEVNVFIRVMIEVIGIPAFHRGLDQENMIVMVNRDKRRVIEQDGLRFLKERIAGRGIDGTGGFEEQLVVQRIFPAGVIVAAVSRPDAEKTQRIFIVADPDRAQDLKLSAPSGGAEAGVFLVGQTHVEAKFTAPHFLHGFGHGAVTFGRIEHELDWRRAFALRVTGFYQQGASGGEIGRDLR